MVILFQIEKAYQTMFRNGRIAEYASQLPEDMEI